MQHRSKIRIIICKIMFILCLCEQALEKFTPRMPVPHPLPPRQLSTSIPSRLSRHSAHKARGYRP